MMRKVEAKGRGIIAQSRQARKNLYLIEAIVALFMEPSECHILKAGLLWKQYSAVNAIYCYIRSAA